MRILTMALASCFALSQMSAVLPKTPPKIPTKQNPAAKVLQKKDKKKAKLKDGRHWTYGSSSSCSSSSSSSHGHDSCSSSSSSSSSSKSSSCCSANLAHVGAYTNNLGLDSEFDPAELEVVLQPIGDLPTAAMIFDTNEPGSPLHVVHPTPGPDYTRFRIEKEGTYLITYTFTIGCIGEGGCLNGAFVQLYDAAIDVALNPNPFQFIDTEALFEFIDSEAVSGQQVIYLPKGAEVQLRIIPASFSYGDLWVANPSMTLTRIAD